MAMVVLVTPTLWMEASSLVLSCRLLTFKAATLANIPCNTAPYADNDFKLDNGNIVDNSTARERNVGLTNRVIGGLLLHQTRTNETLCPQSKFDKIQKTCTGAVL